MFEQSLKLLKVNIKGISLEKPSYLSLLFQKIWQVDDVQVGTKRRKSRHQCKKNTFYNHN